jgi:hypothetical protein
MKLSIIGAITPWVKLKKRFQMLMILSKKLQTTSNCSDERKKIECKKVDKFDKYSSWKGIHLMVILIVSSCVLNANKKSHKSYPKAYISVFSFLNINFNIVVYKNV